MKQKKMEPRNSRHEQLFHERCVKEKSAEEQIDDPRFVRCNNYLLINLAYVEKIENLSVWVGGEMLPISHPRKKAFTDAFGEYVRSRHYV